MRENGTLQASASVIRMYKKGGYIENACGETTASPHDRDTFSWLSERDGTFSYLCATPEIYRQYFDLK